MKKMNLLRNSLFALLGACMLWSCVEKKSYLTAVPYDTQTAIKINPGVIFDKTNLASNTQFQSLMMAANGLIGMSVKDQDVVKTAQAAIKNPSDASGIDFNKPIVVTASGVSDFSSVTNAELYAILPVKDSDKMAKMFEGLTTIDKEEHFTTGSYDIKGITFYFGFNERSLVISLSPNRKGNICGLLNQETISVSNTHFDAFVENDDDIVAWFDYDTYMNLLTSMPNASGISPEDMKKSMADMQGSAIMTSTNASFGCLSWTIKGLNDQEIPSAALKADEIIKRLPENSAVAMAFKFDKDIMLEQMEKQGGEGMKAAQETLKEQGLEIDKLLDILASGFGAGITGKSKPEMVFIVGGLDEELRGKLANSMNLPKTDQFEFNWDGTYGTFKTKGYEFSKNLTDTRIADIISDGGLAIDFKKFNLSTFGSDSKTDQIVNKAIGLLDYAQFIETEDHQGAKFDIVFNHPSKNALEIIADFVLNNVK